MHEIATNNLKLTIFLQKYFLLLENNVYFLDVNLLNYYRTNALTYFRWRGKRIKIDAIEHNIKRDSPIFGIIFSINIIITHAD